MGGHSLRIEMVLTKRKMGAVAAVALAAGLSVFSLAGLDGEPTMQLAAWQGLAIPGDLSAAHGHLRSDCGACHTAVEAKANSFKVSNKSLSK